MSTPVIIFDLNKELDKKVCLEFLNVKVGGIDFGKGILQIHPQLKKILNKNRNNQEMTVSLYVEQYYQAHKEEMEEVLYRIKLNWGKISQEFYKNVETVFEGYPWLWGNYHGCLSIFDINPRFLETKSFQVFYLKKENDILGTIAHEMLHFMFYDYLAKTFPSRKNFSEEVIWNLSELFNTIVLSQDEFKRLRAGSDSCYPELSRYLPQIKTYWLKRKNPKNFIQKSLKYLKMVTSH